VLLPVVSGDWEGNRRSDAALDMHHGLLNLEPDLQNILRQSYDYLTIMPKLRSTYDERLIYQTSYEKRRAFLRYDIFAKS